MLYYPKRLVKFFLHIVLLFAACASFSQAYLPKNTSTLYSDEDLPRVDITIDQSDLDFILSSGNEQSNKEFPATFSFVSDNRQDYETNVGFRLRGNTSRYSAKKSFKISFNAFEKGRKLDGFEKLNFNGEHNDPTIVRSKLLWDIFNELGVPSSRCNHVELYINGEYRGLYINVEHVDENFVKSRFGNKKGNLYKCLYPADLSYLGDDPDLYKLESSGRPVYELKTNEDANDYSGLAHFIKVLNQTPDAQFEAAIQHVFDVKNYLKAQAAEALAAHWDNYGINQNNYYLYDNPDDGKFHYIPYDIDNTLGIDWLGEDWVTWNIYEWYRDERPLTKRLMEVESFREEFTRDLYGLLKNQLNPDTIFPKIDDLKAMIQDAAERDQYRTYDYGWSIDDFNNSFTQRLEANHVPYGLKEYITNKHQTASDQLETVIILSNPKLTSYPKIYPNPASDFLNITLPPEYSETTVTLFSLDGKAIWSKSYSDKHLSLNPTIKPGTYLLMINSTSANKSYSQKILIR